jgi:hypothetical protein
MIASYMSDDNSETMEISEAYKCRGRIIVRPSQQEPSNIGWMLLPEDWCVVEGEGSDRFAQLTEVQPAIFLDSDGHCYNGDDEFNFFIKHA